MCIWYNEYIKWKRGKEYEKISKLQTVLQNNAVVDDEIDYSIYGVATDINEAKKIFNQAVKDAKTDSDFDNLNAIEENSSNFKNKDGEWIYSESDDSFELWCNGEYNSNNYSIQIKKYALLYMSLLPNSVFVHLL